MFYKQICFISIFSCLFIGIAFSANAQSNSDSIISTSKFLNYKYQFRGVAISPNKVLEIMQDSTPAYEHFSSANEARIFSYIFGTSGVLFVAVPALMSVFGNNKAWGMAYAGVCLVAVSVPLFMKYKNQTIRALDLYNQNVKIHTAQLKTKLTFQVTQNGLTFCLNF